MTTKLGSALAAVVIAAVAGTAAAPAGGAGDEPRIVGGHVATAGAYPWMVSLVAAGAEPIAGHGCGASLIGSRTVLTAAHCVAGLTPQDVDALVGADRLSAGDGRRVDVARYAIHPGSADVALIDLAEPVAEPPVGLATTAEAALYAPGLEATAIGWGIRKETGGAVSDDLREVNVPIVSDPECREDYRGNGGIQPRTMICAGAQGRDTCQGDSGGPLFVRDAAGSPLQVGVTSFGRGCGRARFPGVYVEVPAMLGFVADPAPVYAPIPERGLARITGEPAVGSRLTCDEGSWEGDGVEFRYLWTGGFNPRARSRERTFTPGANLAGKRVSCAVIAHNAGGFVERASLPVRVRGDR